MSTLAIRAVLGLLAGTLIAIALASGGTDPAPPSAAGPVADPVAPTSGGAVADDETAPKVARAKAGPPAGPVDSADYFHVGDSLSREYYKVGDPVERRRLIVQGCDHELIFGFEQGVLKLYGFKVQRKRVKSDLVDLATPAVIGTAEQGIGGGAHQTAVSASAPVDVDLNGIKQRVQADMTGTIGASWHPAAPVKVDADTEYVDVVELKLDVNLQVAAPVFGVPMEYGLDTELYGTLARDFGYVELRIDGDVFRLLPD